MTDRTHHRGAFPARISGLLIFVAERNPADGRAPYEDEHGEPLQQDAEAALAWVAAHERSAEVLRQLLDVCSRMDLADPAKRPSEDDYQQALAKARAALQGGTS